MKRRNFFKLAAAVPVVAMLPKFSYGATTANVVVVGGGPAGAAVAKYLRTWRGSDNVNVTLVTPANNYVAGMQSNLVVTGALSDASRITRNYNTLQARYGVTIQTGSADSIDPVNQTVSVGGSILPYDYLVLAPGVKYIPYAGDPDATLSYWQGDQASALKNQLDSIRDGETFVMYIPPGTIKGSQAPYGRACAAADYLSTRQTPCTVKVLDGHGSLPALFVNAFSSFNNIAYTSGVTLNSVDIGAQTLDTSVGTISYNAANLIPAQKANLDFALDLLPPSSMGVIPPFAPVNAQTFQSAVPGYDRVYIIGDAQGTNLPKSGHCAAGQAKICASAITRLIAGLQPETSLAVAGVQFNAIQSTNAQTAVFSHSGFQFDGTRWVASKDFPGAGDSASGAMQASRQIYSQGLTWVNALLNDCYM